jgi:hypothetical protein
MEGDLFLCPVSKSEFECKKEDIANCHCTQMVLSDEERKYLSFKYPGQCLSAEGLAQIKAEYAGMPEYYMESGFYVFTEKSHLKRGHCCKSSCRHCPYGFRKNVPSV